MKTLLETLFRDSKYAATYYRNDDIKGDFAILEKYSGPGRDYIWLSRDFGTLLFPLKCGISAAWLAAYRDYKEAEWFFISKGEVTKINSELAITKANQLPELPYDEPDRLITSVGTLLSDQNVTSSGLVQSNIKDKDVCSWARWLEWFKSTEQPVMQKTLENAIRAISSNI
ncbi:hypothetical protein ACPV5U_19270 [Vibrio mediterranei]